MESFTDIATAAYCPRKLYYRRKHEDRAPPDHVAAIRNLAYRYEELLDTGRDLTEDPIAVTPAHYRENLEATRARLERWDDLVDPAETRVFLSGKDANGIAHKGLANPPVPVIVSPGEPPDRGVWKPSIRPCDRRRKGARVGTTNIGRTGLRRVSGIRHHPNDSADDPPEGSLSERAPNRRIARRAPTTIGE